MKQRDLAYLVAQIYLGEKEISGSQDNQTIVDFHKATTLRATDDETPHCSSAMNFWQLQACIMLNPGLAARTISVRGMGKDHKCFFDHAIRNSALLSLNIINTKLKDCDYSFTNRQLSNGVNVEFPTWSALARSFEKFGTLVEEPQLGDVVIFKRRPDNSGSGHVAFFSGFSGNTNRTVYCLGSNQSNAVQYSNYELDRVVCYRTIL
jgi:uncharacterized protein (TIGR02594 family)